MGYSQATMKNTGGVRQGQWDAFWSMLNNHKSLVCSTDETIPFLDYMDMVYSPAAKDVWMRNFEAFGLSWVFPRSIFKARVENIVCAGAKFGNQIKLSLTLGGPGASGQNIPFLPVFENNTSDSVDLIFTPLYEIDGNLPPRMRKLRAKYGRHIVRCARENQMFMLAKKRLQYFSTHPIDAPRVLRYYFPEIMPHFPDGAQPTTNFLKAKNNTFASVFKLSQADQATWAERLGPNWANYKEFIIGLIVRGKMMRDLRNSNPYETTLNRWDEVKKYEHMPLEEWHVQLSLKL